MEAVNIYPELIKWKPNKKGECSITIRFDYKNKRAGNDNLGHKVLPEQWDDIHKRVKHSYPHHVLVNRIIEARLNQHRNHFIRRQAFNLPVNADLVKQYLMKGTLESFLSFAEKLIEEKKLSDGKPYAEDTKRRYRDEVARLMKYQADIEFKDITVQWLEGYKLWLQNTYRKKDNTLLDANSIWKALGFIRMVYNEAIKDELILADDNPFRKFEVGSYKANTDKIKYLEREDLDRIEKLLCSDDGRFNLLTINIGWRFLAMCVSGLRISDAMVLNDAYFNDAGDLEIIPHKTRRYGNKAIVPVISDKQRNYLNQTLARPLPQTNPKNFRTTFNNHLKVIAAAAGVRVDITSHSGRHTMGSFLVDAGVEKKAAKAILGVKRDEVIDTYMHLKESKLRKEAEKLRSVF